MKKSNFISKFNKALGTLLTLAICFTIIQIANATTPNPGHDFSASGGGVAQGDILYGSAADTLSALGKNTSATRYISNTGSSNNPAWAQVSLTDGVTGSLPVANGGTGQTTFSQYDLLFGNTATTTFKLAYDNTPFRYLSNDGDFSNPDWDQVALEGGVKGTLAVSNGGTGLATLTANNVILGNGTSDVTFVAPSTSGNVLTSNGTTWTSATPGAGASRIAWGGHSSASITADVICTGVGYNVCNTTVTTAFGVKVPMNVTLKNLYASIAAAPANGNSCTFTVRKSTTCLASSYSNTTLTCTVTGNGSATTCSDTSNAPTANAGDCLQIFYDETGTCAGIITWGFELEPS